LLDESTILASVTYVNLNFFVPKLKNTQKVESPSKNKRAQAVKKNAATPDNIWLRAQLMMKELKHHTKRQ
jgi:hypothetical protein